MAHKMSFQDFIGDIKYKKKININVILLTFVEVPVQMQIHKKNSVF